MTEYLFLLFAVLCIGGQFALTKFYQMKVGEGLLTSFLFLFFSAVSASIVLAFFCDFQFHFNWFSFLMAAGGTLCVVLYTILGIKMMSIGKVAVYTLFVMLGGMFLPFLYGILFLGEALSIGKIAGVIVLIAALSVPVFRKNDEKCRNKKLFFLLGILVFFANGMVGVFNKIHQISEYAVSTFEFGFWQNVISAGVLLVVVFGYIVGCRDRKQVGKTLFKVLRQWWIILAFTVVCQAGSMFQLFAAKKIDASFMFPVVTGGTILASALFGWLIFKEKVDKLLVLNLVLVICSTGLFVVFG